jgi:hypothetical protein
MGARSNQVYRRLPARALRPKTPPFAALFTPTNQSRAAPQRSRKRSAFQRSASGMPLPAPPPPDVTLPPPHHQSRKRSAFQRSASGMPLPALSDNTSRRFSTSNVIVDMKNQERRLHPPKAYFITFTCYGTHLPGDGSGWATRKQNVHGTPFPEASNPLESYCVDQMKDPRYKLDQTRRGLVRKAILEICRRRGWLPRAIHVRPLHVHSVVEAEAEPDIVLNAFKCRASFRLNRSGLDPNPIRRWTEDGSKKYLWTDEQVNRAVDYVLYEQGDPMEVFSLRADGFDL